MGLFTKSKRKRSRVPEGSPAAILRSLTSLQGHWSGFRREIDTQSGQTYDIPLELNVELSPERTHLILHYALHTDQGRAEAFEALGLEETGAELARTHFKGDRRQTQYFRIARWEEQKPGQHFQLVLTTTGWDEARPCEIEWRILVQGKKMEMRTRICLINQEKGFEDVSLVAASRR